MESVVFVNRTRFAWKTALLLVATLALIPILGMRHELAGTIYVIFLTVVHVVGVAIFIIGVSKEDIAPSKWGFIGRAIGLASLMGLLYLASLGLRDTVGTIFWVSLGAIWALHTLGLLLLHLRGTGETACPFA